jgi:predicted transcriptional regulator
LGNYRRKFDIIADILHVVSQTPRKTQIMYKANLSFRVLKKYLTELREASLICYQEENQCYTLTVKGQQFLDAYREYSRTSKYVTKVLNDVNSKKANLQKLFNE